MEMENIVIYPKNMKQKSLLESLLKEMKIHFDVLKVDDESLLSKDEFLNKIEKSLKQASSGETTTLSKSKQKELLGL